MLFFIYLLALANAISAAPNVVLPVNSQLPPVARISQTFSFVFAESTFASSGTDLTYSLSEAPGWLHLDSSSRTLYGTPEPEDLGSLAIKLTATDNTGSTPMDVKLLVSSRIGPSLGNPVSEQLPAFGAFSQPNSLLISPTSVLHLSFSKITFGNTDANTAYYATSADNTPLPPWLKFDPENLSFSGTTPDSIPSGDFSKNFDIHLTASDEVGYSAATVSFRIVVETHLFSFRTGLHIINATQGIPFNFSGLQTNLLLDGQPLNKTADLAHIVADIPEWMSLNESSLVLSGTPPVSAVSQNLTVTATSVYYDVADTVFLILLPGVSQTTFFHGYIGTLNATMGSDFDYKIDHSFFTRPDLLISLDLGVTASWLSFDPANLKIHDSVPGDLKPEIAILNMTASQGMQCQSQIFMIAIQEGNEEGKQGSGGPNNSTGHTTSPPATFGSSKHWLPAAVLVPTAVILGLLLVALLYVRNRRLRRSKHGPRKIPKNPVVSRPIMQESSWITVSDGDRARAIGPGEHRIFQTSKNNVAGLSTRDLSIRNSQNQAAMTTAAERGRNSRHDSWRDFVGRFDRLQREHNTSPEFSLEGKNMTGGRVRSSSLYSRPESRWSDCLPLGRNPPDEKSRAARFMTRSVLPPNQPLSAFGPASTGDMGHGVRMEDGRSGSGIDGPRGFGIVRPSWRNTIAHSLSPSEHATTTDSSMDTSETLSSIVQHFPRTPSSRHKISRAAQKYATPRRTSRSPQKQVTIRKVRQSPPEPMKEISTLAAFHKQRVSIHYRSNPLFSAGPSSRVSSNSLWKKAQRNSTAKSTKYSLDYREFEPSITPKDKPPPSRDLGPRRRLHSRSSSFRPFSQADNTSPSPAPRRIAGSPGNSSPLLINLTRFARPCRRHSRSISLTSSQRFGSAIMTEDDDNNSSGYGELLVGEAYVEDSEEIAIDDNDEEGPEEVEESDIPWRHAGLPNPLGHHSPIAHEFDLRRWRDETPGPRPRTAGKFPERSAAREVESIRYQTKPSADEQYPSEITYPLYSETTTPCKTVGIVGKRPNTVTERNLKQQRSLARDISGIGFFFPSPSSERTAANPSPRPEGSSTGACPPPPSRHPSLISTPSSPEKTLPLRPVISRNGGGGGQSSALLTLSEMLSQQQDPTSLETISLASASPHGELQQSLESDNSPLSITAVEQAEGTGSRRRIKEEEAEEREEDRGDKGRFFDLGVCGENTEGASRIGAFL